MLENPSFAYAERTTVDWDWAGLDWAELDWTGTGLGWIGLDWIGLGWTELGLDWDWTGLGMQLLSRTRLDLDPSRTIWNLLEPSGTCGGWRQPGVTHPGGNQKAPKRHQGGTQEAPSTQAPEGIWEACGSQI